ncbi:hypothetical protein R3I94_009368 [Phoxinus phoxinus]
MMDISVTFLLTGCLIQGVFCVFNISLPERVEALRGSCVFIPCTFDINDEYVKALTEDAKRIWFKDTSPTAVFNSSSPDTGLLKGEIFGSPTEKNCTTRFDEVNQSHNGSYYFRIEAKNKDKELKFSYKKNNEYRCSQVEIGVIDSPPKPTVSLFKDQQEVKKVKETEVKKVKETEVMEETEVKKVTEVKEVKKETEVKKGKEVKEGSSVNLRCSTKIFCSSRPASLTWSSSPEHLLNESVTQQQRQEQTELISDLIFTVTHRHHLANFTCTVTHHLQELQTTKHKSRTLRVQYAPKNTSAHVNASGVVLEGRSVTLSCSSDANPPVLNYTWYRDTEEPLKPVPSGPNLTISNTDPTHSGRYVCTAQNEHGAQNASVMLDVQYAPKNTSAHVNASGVVLEGRSVTLSCSSDANPPVLNYTWYRDTEEPLKPVQSGPTLTISNTDPTHSGRYVCTAQNEHGAQNASVMLDVQYAPKNTSAHVNGSGVVLEGRSVTLSCSSDANPPVLNYTWYRDTEEPLKPVPSGPNLTISNTDPTHSGRYICTAQNEHGAQNASVMLDVQYAPKNTSLSFFPSGTMMEGRPVTLTCSTDAKPAAQNFSWYKETGSQFELLQTGFNHTYVVSNPTHSARYRCTAQNQHGQHNTTIQLAAQFAPKISSSCNKSSKITCVCEAHGNPPPKLEWRLSGNVLANSTNTFIRNETSESTSLKSVLIFHQPLTDTDVLQCFSANTLGTASASQRFHPVPQTHGTETRFHHPSVLLGLAVGASVMMVLCIMAVYNERRRNPKPSGTRQDETSGLILSQIATASDGDGEYVYGNKAVTSRAPESLHYSSIDFTNAEPASGEIRGVSSLTEEYAVIRYHSAGDAASATDLMKDQSPQDSSAKITDVSSEDTIYENMTCVLDV